MKFTKEEIDANRKAFEALNDTIIADFPAVKSDFLNKTPFSLNDLPEEDNDEGANAVMNFLFEYTSFSFLMDDEIEKQYLKYDLPKEFPKRHVPFTTLFAAIKKIEMTPGITVLPEKVAFAIYSYQGLKHFFDFSKIFIGTKKYGVRKNAIQLNIILRNFFRKLEYGDENLVKANNKLDAKLFEQINLFKSHGYTYDDTKKIWSNMSKGIVEDILLRSIQNDFYFDPLIFKKGIDYAVLFDLYYPFLKHDFTIYDSEESPGYRSQNSNYHNFDAYKRHIMRKIIEKRWGYFVF